MTNLAKLVVANAELVAAVVGVLLGFVLSEVASWWRERRRAHQKANAVRAVLRIEMAKNLDQLKRMIDTGAGSLPVQSNHVWASQLATAPESLTAQEIRAVHDFYYDLYGLRKLGPAEVRPGVIAFMEKPSPLPGE